jgi:arabinogalactan endo-1,4-beta-galactosidase
VYYNQQGQDQNALRILGDAGMNYVRLRVWVNPEDGFDDEQELLEGARQAKAHHMKLLLDFHCSDTWTDPGDQVTPAAWANDTLPQLEAQIYSYSKKVVGDLVRQGTPPAMVQTGNEINGGFLWPTGFDYGPTDAWPTFGALLKSAISGVFVLARLPRRAPVDAGPDGRPLPQADHPRRDRVPLDPADRRPHRAPELQRRQ